ncbi:hypothetical protein AMTRI_Chr08g202890 [Amborella trichopoda]
MNGNNTPTDNVVSELLEMGFEFPIALAAIEAVGPSLYDAVDFILTGSCNVKFEPSSTQEHLNNAYGTSSREACTSKNMQRSFDSKDHMKQALITDHLSSSVKLEKSEPLGSSDTLAGGFNIAKSKCGPLHKPDMVQSSSIDYRKMLSVESSANDMTLNELPTEDLCSLKNDNSSFHSTHWSQGQGIDSKWETKVNFLLKNYFGISSLKSFQKEALEAWLAHRDCLVLAATGSGKSLCFQIPALLTGKVVVVVSPLISLMHDQCLKLSKQGVSACFLGSGQPDNSVEDKALNGKYNIVYICPETILRLIAPLRKLAETRGIALFAVDEAHCVSKWGHDFRPDYRRLSVLRKNFRTSSIRSLEHDIPVMALTATATHHAREDIIKSLHMSKETKIVITSFFRPNLRFSVCHSRTSSVSSYQRDFKELIATYSRSRVADADSKRKSIADTSDGDESSEDDVYDSNDEASSDKDNIDDGIEDNELSVDFLEDELDLQQNVDDIDVTCGEFNADHPVKDQALYNPDEVISDPVEPVEKFRVTQESLGEGTTIIYVPTRKETVRLSGHLCKCGIRSAAYHAKLPKRHLRSVHEEFHRNNLEFQVVVATIAFGMGIDKSNVRRIIHYGWPQSLEAYYQEAGRAGRDGKLAECTLYADLSRVPTLLPSKRDAEQAKNAVLMLSDCFRYGMATSCCRAKTLVKYFGEELISGQCFLCDVCVSGPPKLENLKDAAAIFLQVAAAQYGLIEITKCSYSDAIYSQTARQKYLERPNFNMLMDKIWERAKGFSERGKLWWRGLARMLEDKGYIREGDDLVRVSIKYPKPTELGMRFLEAKEDLYVYPEADMLLSLQNPTTSTYASEWARGWANPEIRRQRIQSLKRKRGGRKKYPRKKKVDLKTVRGRLKAKLVKKI